MIEYNYSGINDNGKNIKGTVKAENETEARNKLKKENLYIYNLVQNKENKSINTETKRESNNYSLNLTNKGNNIIFFTEQFANLLLAGIKPGGAIKVIADILNPGKFKDIVKDIHLLLTEGKSFTEALSYYPDYFSNSYISMIKAGEESGYLGETCQKIARNLQENKELKSHIFTSLIYPVILFIITSVAVIIMFTFVLPRFLVIYEAYGESLPWTTSVLLAFSGFVTNYWIYIIVLAVLFIMLFSAFLKTKMGKDIKDKYILKLPLFGSLFLKLYVTRITRSIALMINSGVPLLKALRITTETTNNNIYYNKLLDIETRIKKGMDMSEAFNLAGGFPHLVVYLIGVGEKTGELSSMLYELADNYEKEYREGLDRIIKITEPFMILFMGLLIGFFVIAMLLPILSMSTIY